MNRSTNTKRTLQEWSEYIKVLEEELAVRTADSNTLEEIIDVMKKWENTASNPGSYTRQANRSALHNIYDILEYRIRNTKQEGL